MRSIGPTVQYLAGGVLLLSLVSCDGIFEACTADLQIRMDPRQAALRVGDSFTARASAWGCGGTERLAEEWRYFASDTNVVRVDSLTGRVIARAAGVADVGAHGATYGVTAGPALVTVTP